MRLRPYRALRPSPEVVERVVAPPYDVVSRSEAAAHAEGNPQSFLHVGRADIDLPDEVDAYDPRVYAKARENLDRLIAEGTLRSDASPRLFLYRQVMAGRAQHGVVGCVSVEDYERDVIKKHERTRPDKEDDRTRHILTLGAHAEPVLLAYRDRPELDRLAVAAMTALPLYDFTAADGVRHTVWPATDGPAVVAAFERVPCAYVADGHHRTASASRAATERRTERRGGMAGHESDWFPAALFPANQLAILPYNRVIRDLGGRTTGEVLHQLARVGRLTTTQETAPARPATFCIYLEGRWYLLEVPDGSAERGDPIRALDVWLLQERVLEPVFGITDQRTDKRIDFVGGIRGTRDLEARVDSGEAALAISMYPTTVEQLMAVADAGEIMPPKSTWFEPKLLSGLFVHTFD